MNSEITEKYYVLNGRLIQVSETVSLTSYSSRTIYEVIRVISGVPLFLESHMERLETSARLIDCSIEIISDKIQNSIMELINANTRPDKNIKVLVYNLENKTPDYLVYFIQSSYPTSNEYRNGVHTILIKEERNNPNAKIVNSDFKKRIAAALSDANAYEALLINRENEITEGSRSNVFFVKNGTVLTAPKGNILIGITRVCIFQLCKALEIKWVEKSISLSMLKEMEAAFMTGTSPKILPISTIDEMSFNSAENQVVKALMKGYDDMIAKYINEKTPGCRK